MNSRELRIGNYVEVDGEVAEVVAINKDEENDLKVRVSPGNVFKTQSAKANPIKLTQAILKKCCNFDDDHRYILGMDNHRYFLRFRDGYILLADKKDEPIIHFWDVRQLHQLQNLYHAIKGVDIEVSVTSLKKKTASNKS